MTKNGDDRSAHLLDEFRRPTYPEWRAEAERMLAGTAFEKRLFTPTVEGITLRPLYTAADDAKLPHLGGQPGIRPFVRGAWPLGHRQAEWLVAQELPFPTYEQFDAALRHDQSCGQTAVNLILDRAGQAGLDPDQAAPGEVGVGGTSIASVTELGSALASVDLQQTPLLIQAGSAGLPLAAMLVALVRQRQGDPAQLRGSVGMDPLCGLVELGGLPVSLPSAYDELAAVVGWAADHAPQLRTVAAYGLPYHEAGGSGVQELAFTLAVALHHLRALQERGLDVEVVAPRIQFGFAVGSHFFMEIAKLRAARLVWSEIVAACGASEAAQRMNIHARTSRFNKTRYDRHVNILRGTTEAMAAVFGGADSLHVAPFDEPLGLPGERSRRLARNTQLILREESHFDAVVDPAGGSWYIESLTAEMAEKAWALLQEIETAGGMLSALQDGLPQRMVAATAAVRATAVATRREIFVGVNMYPDHGEAVPVPNLPDYAAIGEQRAAQSRDLRTGETQAHNVAVLQQLGEVVDSQAEELFEKVVTAAGAGASIGELTKLLRHRADPDLRVEPIEPWRAAEAFEALRTAVAQHRARQSDACAVYCANLGDVARYMPRLDFARAFFEVGGFAVQVAGCHAAADAAAVAALDSGAQIVVIVGRDETYATQAAETARRLKAIADPPTVILAGQPPDQIDALQTAGVDRLIHVGSDALLILRELAVTCGVEL